MIVTSRFPLISCLFLSVVVPLPEVGAAEPIPEQPSSFLASYCLECHDELTEKGEVNLDFLEIAWEEKEARHHWERVLDALADREMPPEDEAQPSEAERKSMLAWLDRQLTEHSRTGGTVVRRLNQDEYLATVRNLFGGWVELPNGFPVDHPEHGFDTVGESLILSPPLMAAYAEAAATIADEIFPPERPSPPSTKYTVPPEDMVISYSSGSVRDGAMRLAIGDPVLSRSGTWPSKVELKHSGRYRVRVDASAFARKPDSAPMTFQILARDVSSDDGVRMNQLRLLNETKISDEEPTPIEFEAELYEGETIVFYWADAPLTGDKAQLAAYLERRFGEDPRLLAAWQQVKHDSSLRGGLGWERVKALMADESLDLSEATLDSPKTKELIKTMTKNVVLYYETIAFEHFEKGPALEIHGAEIEGPLEIVDGPRDKRRKAIQAQLLGEQGDRSEESWLREVLERFLSRAFRRPVDARTVDGFFTLVNEHRAEGHSLDQGLHLALRTALISPRFLYREITPGPLDDHDLAARLAYFLTVAPPDDQLRKLADEGKLADPKVLRSQAKRLLPNNQSAPMISHFTGQWLDLRLLEEIMPDPRLQFTLLDQRNARDETRRFFVEMLRENRPMTDFIDPDFTFTSARIAKNIYGIEDGYNPKKKDLQRLSLKRGGRYGGLLGQASVLMATANGVDTQPVVRGVWVLENIIGDPPPPPSKAVPAITPDTTGATTPRELLAAHASEESCAACHRKIDPIGFALENFDAVGRWRDHYANWQTDEKGRAVANPAAPVDPTGQLPDGTPIADVVDLKRWIVEHIDEFSQCLAEQLLTYATGREPNYVERKEIAEIVKANHETGNGFRDLLLALVASETFRTK